MNNSRTEQKLHELERGIESKRTLLDYLRSQPKRLSVESFFCLADILRMSGWILEGERWGKRDKSLGCLEAAVAEMTEQISIDRDLILRHTVKAYRKGSQKRLEN